MSEVQGVNKPKTPVLTQARQRWKPNWKPNDND
jgi:hypothetical protein